MLMVGVAPPSNALSQPLIVKSTSPTASIQRKSSASRLTTWLRNVVASAAPAVRPRR